MKKITLKKEQIGDDILIAFCESECINGRIVHSITDNVLFSEWMFDDIIGTHSYFTKLNLITGNFQRKCYGAEQVAIECEERSSATDKWLEEQENKMYN